MAVIKLASRSEADMADLAASLQAEHGMKSAEAILELAFRHLFVGDIAVVSSFGAESAVLLHLVAGVDPSIPVLFIDTDKMFGETLRYRNTLTRKLGLTDVRTLVPDPAGVMALDPMGALWLNNGDLCCQIRKVEPLAQGLSGFGSWVSGRKRFQSPTRAAIPVFEAEGGRIKINPLAAWGPAELQAYATAHGLTPHPLVAQGYPSIGCMPCTAPVAVGEDAREGRWRGMDKTECGIHLAQMIAPTPLATAVN